MPPSKGSVYGGASDDAYTIAPRIMDSIALASLYFRMIKE